MFWIGFLSGAIFGGNLGVLIMACFKIRKN